MATTLISKRTKIEISRAIPSSRLLVRMMVRALI
jgi:hypothetical protein